MDWILLARFVVAFVVPFTIGAVLITAIDSYEASFLALVCAIALGVVWLVTQSVLFVAGGPLIKIELDVLLAFTALAGMAMPLVFCIWQDHHKTARVKYACKAEKINH